ncbi:MAG: hypothetical protein GX654_16505 [Desulfatiglans sp.]|nr:hypothetical protein [Desulfatiglans sp.]
MNLWTMIVMIVAICVIGDIIKLRNKKLNDMEKPASEASNLLTRLMKRIENLETIVLEKERTKQFDELR